MAHSPYKLPHRWSKCHLPALHYSWKNIPLAPKSVVDPGQIFLCIYEWELSVWHLGEAMFGSALYWVHLMRTLMAFGHQKLIIKPEHATGRWKETIMCIWHEEKLLEAFPRREKNQFSSRQEWCCRLYVYISTEKWKFTLLRKSHYHFLFLYCKFILCYFSFHSGIVVQQYINISAMNVLYTHIYTRCMYVCVAEKYVLYEMTSITLGWMPQSSVTFSPRLWRIVIH